MVRIKKIIAKIVFIGDGAVGKTSLLKRYLGREFDHDYMMTIGVDRFAKEMTIRYRKTNIIIVWNIWDLAGQPHWINVRSPFYKGAIAGVLVYDVSNPDSYENVENWLHEMIRVTGIRPIVLVANKIDLREIIPECITTEEGLRKSRELSKILGIEVPYIETSAKLNINVEKIFDELGNLIIREAIRKIREKGTSLNK